MTTFEINSNDDIIDVRDIIERIGEIAHDLTTYSAEAHAHPELVEEHAALCAIMRDLKGNGGDEEWRGDWYPVTLIRDSYFKQAMDEMVADCYTLPELPSFMTVTLDYVALQMDYTSTEIDGVTYWYC